MKKRKKKADSISESATDESSQAKLDDVSDTDEEVTAVSDPPENVAASEFDQGTDTAVGAPPVMPEVSEAHQLEEGWEGPTHEADLDRLADLAAQSVNAEDAMEPIDAAVAPGRLESVVESLLFASERPLTVAELKRLLGERDGNKVTAALEALAERRRDSGVPLIQVAGGWQLRTHPDNVAWVSRLVTGRPQRLSRAMLEALSIVAYRQPITRPEIDEIRGVDCGPVLKTLLDRGLVRMIGKKEEVGRPILYGTTPEFLRIFSLRDLSELPTLREFHELGAAEMAKVDAEAPPSGAAAEGPPPVAAPASPPVQHMEPDEDDELLSELERATAAAAQAASSPEAPPPAETGESPPHSPTTD
jgi:segregation and condensation protein B